MDTTPARDQSAPPGEDGAGARVDAAERATDLAVDARQDELMAIDSSEGRPPSHAQRMSGWRWLAILVPVLVLGTGAVAMLNGASASDLLRYGIVFALLLLLGGLPRWAAGLSRGKEEATARREAVAQIHPGRATPRRARSAEP